MAQKTITAKELAGKGLAPLPDVPGLPAHEMKAKFEELVRDVVIPVINHNVEQVMDKEQTMAEMEALAHKTAQQTLGKSQYDPRAVGKDGFAAENISLQTYTMPQQAQAVRQGDSVCEAIGKLEKKLSETTQQDSGKIQKEIQMVLEGTLPVPYLKKADDSAMLGGKSPNQYTLESKFEETAQQFKNSIQSVKQGLANLEKQQQQEGDASKGKLMELAGMLEDILDEMDDFAAGLDDIATGEMVAAKAWALENIPLAERQNLNNITQQGMYSCELAERVKTLVNCPASTGFCMMVHQHPLGQFLVENGPDGKIYQRLSQESGWTAWRTVFTSTNPPAWQQIQGKPQPSTNIANTSPTDFASASVTGQLADMVQQRMPVSGGEFQGAVKIADGQVGASYALRNIYIGRSTNWPAGHKESDILVVF